MVSAISNEAQVGWRVLEYNGVGVVAAIPAQLIFFK